MRPVAAQAPARLGPVHLTQVYADPDLPLYSGIRRAWPGTLIADPALTREEVAADGGMRSGERLPAAGADLIALGRGFPANPDLVERLRTGAPLNEVRPEFLMYVQGAEGYTDHPVLDASGIRAAAPSAGGPRGGRRPAAV
ncbi:hypothetical protein ACFV0H_35885 [Streptomyces erythrochromogenes]|uniref:hypothetical protein n=1 Tax=Streptomyces erythrochromogenes TaxID=285574 RepID=UPI0004CD47D7|nr:hypothetical protein [Streptomyces erythrochromogenes]